MKNRRGPRRLLLIAMHALLRAASALCRRMAMVQEAVSLAIGLQNEERMKVVNRTDIGYVIFRREERK